MKLTGFRRVLEDEPRRLTELTPNGLPVEGGVLLYKYYIANQEEGREYVVLPNQNFNAFFGTTAFSQKWTAVLTGKGDREVVQRVRQ